MLINDTNLLPCEAAARLERKSFLWLEKQRQKDWEWKTDKAAQIFKVIYPKFSFLFDSKTDLESQDKTKYDTTEHY